MLLLFDGSNMLHRILHTPQFELKSSKGVRTGLICGAINSIGKQCRKYHREFLPIVAWDEGRIKFRQEIYPPYKEWKNLDSRDEIIKQAEKESPEEAERLRTYFWSKMKLHTEILPCLGIPSVMVPGVEADDIIAHIVYSHKVRSIIIGSDDDLMQLISDDVQVYKPNKDRTYYKEDFISEYDLDPVMYREEFLIRKAFLTDASDNLPGIKGIGGVNASRIAKSILKGEELDKTKKINQTYLANAVEHSKFIKCMNLQYFYFNAREEQVNIKDRLKNCLVNSKPDMMASLQALDSIEAHDTKYNIGDIIDSGLAVRQVLKEIIY